MASTSSLAPPIDPVEKLSNAVYEGCLPYFKDNPRFVFTQSFIQDLEDVPDNIFLLVVQSLVNQRLFKLVQDAEGISWRMRSVEDAKKYRGLSFEQEAVYSLIDESGSEGMWSKTIKAKANLHDAIFRSAIKFLESRNMIADMKTVEAPTRKMYIKASIRPSDRATGGSFYTDSALDEEFISMVCRVMYDYIWKKSFYRSSGSKPGPNVTDTKRPKKVVRKKSAAKDTAKIKAEEGELPPAIVEDPTVRNRKLENMLPMPPGYQDYPTLTDLTAYIESSPVTTTTLTESDVQQLVDILVFDDMVEQVAVGSEGVAYKATRKGLKEVLLGATTGNGFTTVPCGNCPVFDLCEEGGVVSPSRCEYFQEWLLI